jgi:hypothetical protein
MMLAKGAIPVPVANRNSRLPGTSASWTSVPTGLGRITIVSPSARCCSREVSGPSGTLIE